MSEHRTTTCHLTAPGHRVHPSQLMLALRGRPPMRVEFVGEHDSGILVAPVGRPDRLHVWCMHEPWRAVVREAVARGVRILLAYENALARIGGDYVSHTSPEHWHECPGHPSARDLT